MHLQFLIKFIKLIKDRYNYVLDLATRQRRASMLNVSWMGPPYTHKNALQKVLLQRESFLLECMLVRILFLAFWYDCFLSSF